MLAYSLGVEISRILHNSFAITWDIGSHVLVILLFYQLFKSIPKELYITLRIHFLFCAPLNLKHCLPENLFPYHYFMKLCKHFGISLHKLLGDVCYLWFPRVTIHLYNNIQLTMSGLCDHRSNLYGLNLVYGHADGAECLSIAQQEEFPC